MSPTDELALWIFGSMVAIYWFFRPPGGYDDYPDIPSKPF